VTSKLKLTEKEMDSSHSEKVFFRAFPLLFYFKLIFLKKPGLVPEIPILPVETFGN
jgi:hypothetical protein